MYGPGPVGGGGGPSPGLEGGTPVPGGGYPRWGVPPLPGQQSEYAACSHAGGLACCMYVCKLHSSSIAVAQHSCAFKMKNTDSGNLSH